MTAANPYAQQIQRTYYQTQVNTATPLQLVLMTHDFIIKACQKENKNDAEKGLKALSDALDFSYPEISLGLYNIYQWCLRAVQENDYQEVIKTIQELRRSWEETQKQQTVKIDPNKTVAISG